MTTISATYSPDDNKLRLYASSRLDAETYARVKAAGYKWAPKQELFVAPMWTPTREDLALELAGEIDDEDKSLVERAEERAERFEDYSKKRMSEAKAARDAVDAIADGIPCGQPILVGHHSERRARKDQERINNGMRKAVSLWETSGYWKARAHVAIHHAKYKEKPEVRARRIKTIEADKRKSLREKERAETWLRLWTKCGDEQDAELQMRVALKIANACWLYLPRKEGDREDFTGAPTAYNALTNSHPSLYAPRSLAEIIEHAKKVYPLTIACCDRWVAHFDNRLTYERAMLEEQGGSGLLKPPPRRKLAPLLNYRAPDGSITTENKWDRNRQITYPQVEMTKAEYAEIDTNYKGATLGPDKQHRFRTAMLTGHKLVCVFLTDSKEHPRPTEEAAPVEPEPEAIEPEAATPTRAEDLPAYAAPQLGEREDAGFAALKATLKSGGAKIVVTPQLFVTPAPLAARVVEIAQIKPGHRVLEPNAGTGALIKAVGPNVETVAVEIHATLAEGLTRSAHPRLQVRHADFLQCNGELGTFDRIVMNPPFENTSDIKHIMHALTMLKPGGRLVAICANGPRQQEKLRPIATEYHDLPAGMFKAAGTNVATALVVIDR